MHNRHRRRRHVAYARRVDLDLRLVRSFVAVARLGHFGRAADERHVTQPALSRQIGRLETQLGVMLITRTSRSVELTPAGREFLGEAEAILRASDRAVRNVRSNGRASRILDVGFMGGIRTETTVTAFSRQRPDIEVRLTHLDWWDQAESLHDGRVDVAFVRPPIDTTGLRLMPLATEPRAVLLPAVHRLADATAVSIMDVLDDPVVAHRSSFADWDAFWTVDPRPDGSHPTRGALVRTVEEKLEVVASGNAIAFMPLSASTAYAHPSVRFLPLHDVAPSTIALAWLSSRRSRTVTAFAEAATKTH